MRDTGAFDWSETLHEEFLFMIHTNTPKNANREIVAFARDTKGSNFWKTLTHCFKNVLARIADKQGDSRKDFQ